MRRSVPRKPGTTNRFKVVKGKGDKPTPKASPKSRKLSSNRRTNRSKGSY